MRTRPATSRCRFSVLSAGQEDGNRLAAVLGWELTSLLDRIAFADYVLNDAVRGQIRRILDRFSDDDFERFCEAYESSLAKDDGRHSPRHEARVIDS